MGRYDSNETGRDIIDNIAVRNASRNIDAFDNAKSLPTYSGSVSLNVKKITLNPIAGKKKIGKQSMICDIVNGTKHFQLNAERPYVLYVDGESGTRKVDVSPTIIKLLKTCVAASFSACEDYTIVLSAFVKTLLNSLPNICLPLDLPSDNKIQKTISNELNAFLREICEEEDIHYTEVVEAEKPKKKKDILMEAAEAGGRKC